MNSSSASCGPVPRPSSRSLFGPRAQAAHSSALEVFGLTSRGGEEARGIPCCDVGDVITYARRTELDSRRIVAHLSGHTERRATNGDANEHRGPPSSGADEGFHGWAESTSGKEQITRRSMLAIPRSGYSASAGIVRSQLLYPLSYGRTFTLKTERNTRHAIDAGHRNRWGLGGQRGAQEVERTGPI